MKLYIEVCIHCERVHLASQIDQLPVPHASSFTTRGLPLFGMRFSNWVNCKTGQHTYVTASDFYEGRVTVDGRKVLPA